MTTLPKLILFGAGEYAEVAHYYFTEDAGRRIDAFVVDDDYVAQAAPGPVPVVGWTEAQRAFPPSAYECFVAIGYSKLNQLRMAKIDAMTAAGYTLATFVHTRAITWRRFAPGSNCFILEHNTVQPFTQVGRGVVMWSGNHLGHHSIVEDGCFITSHVVIAGGVRVGTQSFLGINATVRDHVTIGARNVLGAGAVILGDTPDDALYVTQATEKASIPSSRLRKI